MVSILMSTHNPIKEYFKICLDSIFNQTYKNFEIVLVDDGSDEKVISFIEENNYDLKKFNYIRLDQNIGLPKALNIGLSHCKGEYISRMDDDDIMTNDRLEKQIQFLENNNLDGCFSWYDTIDHDGNIIKRNRIDIKGDKFLDQLLSKGNIFCHASLFLKAGVLKSINGYDENLRFAQDSELYIRILSQYKMDIVKEFLLQHRVNNYRNNSYRETLSLTYSLFGAMNYYSEKGKLTMSEKIKIVERLIRYYVSFTKICKKK